MKTTVLLMTFLHLLLTSNLAAAEPGRTCPLEVIKKDQIASIVERRQSTFKHCLSCVGDTCKFKDWPKEGSDFADACKLLFCASTKSPRQLFLPEDASRKAGLFFTYSISKKGRVEDVEITDLIGDLDDPTARKLIKSFFERRRYEPIVVDGVAYKLANLKDGTHYKFIRKP